MFREIILEPKKEQVHYTKITDQSYVGYMTSESYKFIAVKNAGYIIPIGRSNFIDNNKSQFDNIQDILKNQYKAFEFETFEELIQWLID